MSLPPDDPHAAVRDSVRAFVRRELLPHVDAWEEAGSFPRDLYPKAGAAGILGIGYPEAYGGSFEGDLLAKVAASEELMRCGSGGLVAGLGSLDIALPPVLRHARPALRDRLVPAAIAGEAVMALGVTEPGGGSDVARIQTRAVRDGDVYRVTGAKTFITSGCRADAITLAVRTGGEGHGGISLLVVERGTPGFTTSGPLKKMGWWASDTAELHFDGCPVPAENLLGDEGAGFFYLMENFQAERLSLALMANMTAELALDAALRWAQAREAFGKPIGKHQVIKHRLAEMATLLEASRAMTAAQAQAMARGEVRIKEISMAKNFATDVADRVTYDAVQILGGMGYMREGLVERLYRDARILSIGGGTREVMNELIARQMGL
jgi:acyl-CoA dehydrogenase